ncbi:GCK domain-containing protein [Actinidia rufa]|uniref:GCK domain-containing protein n=1 Tax=Actinidia rufa TaxID=165716 RepID=A0A7J0HEW1_9ERIC|nr:GCK domain-containing protein [Actinidia rufa]
MKGGECREAFVAWEKCIEEAEKNKEDIVEKCFKVTGALKECMEVHQDYYAPILKAEKAAEAEAVREWERERKQKEMCLRRRVQRKREILDLGIIFEILVGSMRVEIS